MTPAAESGDSAEGRKRGRKASPAKGSKGTPTKAGKGTPSKGRKAAPAKTRKAAKDGSGEAAQKADARSRRPAARPRVRLDRLRSGEAIAFAAAILLFVLMFLTWWELGIGGQQSTLEAISLFDRGFNAWQGLEVIPLFLMLAIVVAVGAALLRLFGSDWKPAIPPGAAVCVLGLLATLLILIRMISPPELAPAVFEGTAFPVSLQLPIFLALAAALGIAYGGWRAMGQEGTSFAGIAKRLESTRPTRPKSTADAKPSGRAKS